MKPIQVKPKPMRRYTLKWGNPYTNPPAEMPRVLGSVTLPWDEKPTDLLLLSKPGNGYALCVDVLDAKPPRRLSEETKQRIRRQRLERRVNAKAPLFAEAAIAQALAANPAYFGTKESVTA